MLSFLLIHLEYEGLLLNKIDFLKKNRESHLQKLNKKQEKEKAAILQMSDKGSSEDFIKVGKITNAFFISIYVLLFLFFLQSQPYSFKLALFSFIIPVMYSCAIKAFNQPIKQDHYQSVLL